jgi:polysaccharide export outer membrane protein
MPNVLGDEIAAALRAQHLLVNPVVIVSVVEYAGRGVTVAGAVKTPTTIQDLGDLRVLSALVEAGGLLPGAGPEIIVEQANGTTQRLSVRKLFDGLHPELNIPLGIGSQITVPECERVFVVGDVKRPGAFPFLNVDDTTVLQLLALSGGLDSFSRNKAYIYRTELGKAQKREIEVPLKRILDRKSPRMIFFVCDDQRKAQRRRGLIGLGSAAAPDAVLSTISTRSGWSIFCSDFTVACIQLLLSTAKRHQSVDGAMEGGLLLER